MGYTQFICQFIRFIIKEIVGIILITILKSTLSLGVEGDIIH